MSQGGKEEYLKHEKARLVRQEHSRELAKWLLTAKEFVVSHYPELTPIERAGLEVTVASTLLTNWSNEQRFLLLNDLNLKVSEMERK